MIQLIGSNQYRVEGVFHTWAYRNKAVEAMERQFDLSFFRFYRALVQMRFNHIELAREKCSLERDNAAVLEGKVNSAHAEPIVAQFLIQVQSALRWLLRRSRAPTVRT